MDNMNEVTTYVGIDPGKDGALAALFPDGSVRVCPFDKKAYAGFFNGMFADRTHVTLEHVGAMPGNGGVSMFHFGENFGWIQGILDAHDVPFELVRPQKWKKFFGCTSDKRTSIEAAKWLFPNMDLRRTFRCKGPHDGICEALLLAEYGRRHG